MLVLSRHRGQGIEFPECGISINVLETTSNRVRIGVNAPKEVTILRSELASSHSGTGDPSAPQTSKQEGFSSPQTQLRQRLEQSRRAVAEIAAKSLDVSDNNVRRLLDHFNSNLDLLKDAMLAGELRSQPGETRIVNEPLASMRRNGTAVGTAVSKPDHADPGLRSQTRKQQDSPSANANRETIAGIGSMPSQPSPAVSTRKALLVDDNENESKLLGAFLRLRDYEVQFASDGLSAINYLIDNEMPDVVLLDMAMPNMDGASTIRAIRNEPCFQSLPVIAVSGGTAQEYGVTIGTGGVNNWFQKPLDPAELVENIEQAVKWKIESKETEARRGSSAKERLTGCGSSGAR